MKRIKVNQWYRLNGRFYFVKYVTAEGLTFIDKKNPYRSWTKTGKYVSFFVKNAVAVEESEVYKNS